MKLTLSVIKADIGSIGGHVGPSRKLLDAVKALVEVFDGPPLVTCAAFCVHEGRLTEPLDAFKIRSSVIRADAA